MSSIATVSNGDDADATWPNSVGTYLNRFYVYAIDFVDRGILVGMRRHELELLEPAP